MSDEMEKKNGCPDCGCGEDCKDECEESCNCGEGCDCCEDEDEIITLTDDNGEDIDFYQVATLDYKEKWYTFLEPVELPSGMEPGDLIVFELGEDESGEDVFLPVEDETLLEELFAEFEKLLNEEEAADKE